MMYDMSYVIRHTSYLVKVIVIGTIIILSEDNCTQVIAIPGLGNRYLRLLKLERSLTLADEKLLLVLRRMNWMILR